MKPTLLAGPIVLLAALLSAVVAAAGDQTQDPSKTKWWQSEIYMRELNLTADQSRRLEEIFQAAVPKQKVLKKSLDEAEALFEQLASQGKKEAAAEQINRVIAARAELMKSHSLMLLDMRYELKAEQWMKLGVLQQQTSEKPRPAAKK